MELIVQMKNYILAIAVVAIAGIYTTLSSFLTPPKDFIPPTYDFTNWRAASADSVRSPCPVLNALANHDILPHSGKGLTISLLQQALPGALNIEYPLATVLAVGGLFSSPKFWQGTFNLDDLNAHNFIEHDGSISRGALGITGDAHTFNQTVFDQYMSAHETNANGQTSVETAALARQLRMQSDRELDPTFVYGPKQHIISYGETALILSALGGGEELEVPVQWLRVLWEEERFPFTEGWTRAEKSVGFGTVHEAKAKLVALTGGMGEEAKLMVENFVERGRRATSRFL